MEQVAQWLQKIVAVIILAGFLEMLLPNNDLKNITKMIMGLLIIMLLIQPLVTIFDLPQKISWSVPTTLLPETNLSTRRIIEQGLKMRESWIKGVKEQNKGILEQKIKNLIGLIGEVNLEDLSLNFQGDSLVKAVLKMKLLQPKMTDNVIRKRVRQKVVDSVELLTDLTEEQIEVIWDDGNDVAD